MKKVVHYINIFISLSILILIFSGHNVYAEVKDSEQQWTATVSETSKDKVMITSPNITQVSHFLLEVKQPDDSWLPVGVERTHQKNKEFQPYIFKITDEGKIILSKHFWKELTGLSKNNMRLVMVSSDLLAMYNPINISNYLILTNYSIVTDIHKVLNNDKSFIVPLDVTLLDHQLYNIEINHSLSELSINELQQKLLDTTMHPNIQTKEVDDMFSNNSDNASNNSKYTLEFNTKLPMYDQYSEKPSENDIKDWVTNVRLIDKGGNTVHTFDKEDYKVVLLDPDTVDTSVLGASEYEIEIMAKYEGEDYTKKATIMVMIGEEDDELKGKGDGETPPPTVPTPTTPPSETTPPTSTSSKPSTTGTTSTPSQSDSSTQRTTESLPQLNDQKSVPLLIIGFLLIISSIIFITKNVIKR